MIFLVFLLLFSLAINVVLFVAAASSVSGFEGQSLREKHFARSKTAEDKIALLRVEGLIMESEDGFVDKQVQQILDDDDIKAIVLRVDSPGGAVTASEYQYHRISELLQEKEVPMVVSFGSLAASGGYYVAMASGNQKAEFLDQPIIFAEPTTWSGSIGVYIPLYDATGLAEKYGVRNKTVATHPLKTMGSLIQPVSRGEELEDPAENAGNWEKKEREVWQGLVGAAFKLFKDRVRTGRKKDLDLDQVATGQVFTTEQALQNGLVDQQGRLEDAIDQVITMAGLDKDAVQVVEYKKPKTLVELLMAKGPTQQSAKLSELLKRFAHAGRPQAYYLWGNPLLPGLEQN